MTEKLSKDGDSVAALSLSSAIKTFGEVVALADGRVELVSGEILALIGENGAGKSTVVKILAGVHAPKAIEDVGAAADLLGLEHRSVAP